MPLQSILPVSVSILALQLVTGVNRNNKVGSPRISRASSLPVWAAKHFLRQLLTCWSVSEVAFYFYYVFRRYRLENKVTAPVPSKTQQERQALVDRCLSALDDMDLAEVIKREEYGEKQEGKQNSSVMIEKVNARRRSLKREAVSGWFLGADVKSIRKGNFQQWVAWAFFHKDSSLVTKDEQVEVVTLADQLAHWAELSATVQKGFNPSVKCIRINCDPIPSTYRPLTFYLVTHGVFSLLTELFMRYMGFGKYASCSLEYWMRPGDGACEDLP